MKENEKVMNRVIGPEMHEEETRRGGEPAPSTLLSDAVVSARTQTCGDWMCADVFRTAGIRRSFGDQSIDFSTWGG
jgi:hypothetical protein